MCRAIKAVAKNAKSEKTWAEKCSLQRLGADESLTVLEAL